MTSAINKLVCSFKSDLPNEIDFAMQAATVLANSENFIWSNDYLLVDAICSSLHVYSCVCQEDVTQASCYCYPRFWHRVLDERYANLDHIQAATSPPDTEQSYMHFTSLKDHESSDHNKIYKRIKAAAELIKQFSLTCGVKSTPSTTTVESEKMDDQQNLTNGLSTNLQYQQQQPQQQQQQTQQQQQQNQQQPQPQQQQTQHQSQPQQAQTMTQQNNSQMLQNHNQSQTMSSLNQGSMTNSIPTNNYLLPQSYSYATKKKKLKASPSLLKFVSLLLASKDMPLYLIGLDILSNTASKLSKLPDAASTDSDSAKLVQIFQEHCIDNICCPDGDIYIIIRSIEVISKLISSSNSRVSSAIINLINGSGLLARLEQLLTSRNDVNLFLAALECCYRISRHQPHLIATARAQPMTKILVNLLDCEEKQFFTPTALKRIAVIGEEETSGWTQLPPPRIISRKSVATNGLPNGKAQVMTQGKLNSKTIGQAQPAQTTTQQQQQKQTQPQQQQQQTQQQQQQQQQQQLQQPKQQQQRVQQPKIQSQPPSQPQPTNNQTLVKEYRCEWTNCSSKFPSPKQVYTHVFEVHIGSLTQNELSSCQWTGPNGSGPGCLTKRPKYSLLTHLNDFHCNSAALERALTQSDPIKPPVHPGYGPNAALLAIRRHANTEKNGIKASNNHNSPLSVSVRLTAALILRNLATQSAEMKQALANHETLLSEICMTNGRDESKIIAECLSLFSSH